MIPAILVMLAGCGGGGPVMEAYKAAQKDALRDPGPAPENWQPDVVLHLSANLVDELVQAALRDGGNLEQTFNQGPLKATALFTVKKLKLESSTSCDQCLTADTKLVGEVNWSAGVLGSGTLPVTANLTLDALFDATREQEGTWALSVLPRNVRNVEVELGNVRADIKRLLAGPLQDVVDKELISKIQPLVVGRIGGEALPLRALRVAPAGTGLRFEGLSTAADSQPVKVSGSKTLSGFQVDLSPQALAAMARRATFEAGPNEYGIVIDPSSLAFNGDDFTLGLRLWKVEGGKWWRDYTAKGNLSLQSKRLKLTASSVEEGPKSKGAALADPLAYLGEGIILKTIADSMDLALPVMQRTSTGGMKTEVNVTNVRGEQGMLRVNGTIDIMDSAPKKAR